MNTITEYIDNIEARSVASCKRAINDVWYHFHLPDRKSSEAQNKHVHVHENLHYRECDLNSKKLIENIIHSENTRYKILYTKIIEEESSFYEGYGGSVERELIMKKIKSDGWAGVPSVVEYQDLGLDRNGGITILHGKYPFWRNIVKVVLRGVGGAQLVRHKLIKNGEHSSLTEEDKEFAHMMFPSYMDVANQLIEELW